MNSLSRKGPQGAVWAAPAPGQSLMAAVVLGSRSGGPTEQGLC